MIDHATITIPDSTDGFHQFRLQGQFAHPHWVAFLFSGLAAQEISVVGGHSSQAAAGVWNAEFSMGFGRSRVTAQTFDFRAL